MNDLPPTPPDHPDMDDAEAARLLEAGLSGATSTGRGGFVPRSPAEIQAHFPDLEIEAVIGQGGMGVVYRARQRKLDRAVALKVLRQDLGDDPAFRERFLREAKTMARLDHRHIVRVHDFGEVEGLYFLVMELVGGASLQELLGSGRLAPEEALAIVPQICDALQYAHDQGVVHRDIKPGNVLIDDRGQVKIADFGLAKLVNPQLADPTLTGTQQVMGTVHYMAPEQYKAPATVDHRADIFSLGVVFYEMLTGELPVGRFHPPSESDGLDARVDAIVMRALEREREARYQRADAVGDDVSRLSAAGSSIEASEPSQPHAERAPVGADEGVATAAFAGTRRAARSWWRQAGDIGPWVTLGLVAVPLAVGAGCVTHAAGAAGRLSSADRGRWMARLLTESGLVGTGVLILGLISTLIGIWRAGREGKRHRVNWGVTSVFLVLATAVGGWAVVADRAEAHLWIEKLRDARQSAGSPWPQERTRTDGTTPERTGSYADAQAEREEARVVRALQARMGVEATVRPTVFYEGAISRWSELDPEPLIGLVRRWRSLRALLKSGEAKIDAQALLEAAPRHYDRASVAKLRAMSPEQLAWELERGTLGALAQLSGFAYGPNLWRLSTIMFQTGYGSAAVTVASPGGQQHRSFYMANVESGWQFALDPQVLDPTAWATRHGDD